MKEKSAQDFMESMRRGVSQVPGMASQAGGAIKNWYQNLNPDARNAVMHGLMGAGIGAGVTGGLAALSPHDPEEKRPVMGPALLGALMGGTAGAGIPYGLKLLSNRAQLPGEQSRPVGASLVDKIMGSLISNPGKTVGTALGGGALYKTLRDRSNPLRKTLSDPEYISSPVKANWEAAKESIPFPQKPAFGTAPFTDKLRDNIKMMASSDPMRREVARDILKQRMQFRGQQAAVPIKRMLSTVKNTRPGQGKLGLLALPGGLAAGAILDKYLKGDY